MGNRRKLIVALGVAAATPPALFAQSKQKPVLIGVLNFGSATPGTSLAAFREELAARGWKESAQVTFEVLHAEGDFSRLPALAQALAAKNPTVIVAATSRASGSR